MNCDYNDYEEASERMYSYSTSTPPHIISVETVAEQATLEIRMNNNQISNDPYPVQETHEEYYCIPPPVPVQEINCSARNKMTFHHYYHLYSVN